MSKPSPERRMKAAIDAVRTELASLRTGRANAGIVSGITVDAWGARMPLDQIAQIGVAPPRGLIITPHDPQLTGPIDKALQQADLGSMPKIDGIRIRLELPAPSQEQRERSAKVATSAAEAGRVAVRLARRDGINDLRRACKAGSISEARLNGRSKDLQRSTDAAVEEVDAVLAAALTELGQMA